VCKQLVAAGLGYAVLPPAACGADVDAGRLRCAPICEPEINQQLGVAATAALDLPREFATKIGILLREEVSRLTRSGLWQATFTPSPVWDPSLPEPN
jgi:DNA-binding transcriptional LysR family regulator